MAPALDLAPLVALAVVTMLILILSAYRATVGAVVDWLIAHIPSLHVGIPKLGRIDVFGWISGPLRAFQNLVYSTLARLIQAQHAVWNKFVQWNAYAWEEVSGAISGLAHSTEQAFDYVVRHKIRHLVLLLIGPLLAEIHALKARLESVPANVTRIVHETPHIVRNEITKQTTRVVRITRVVGAAAVAAVAGSIAAVLPRVQRAERELKGIDERLTKLSRQLAPAAVVALVAVAVGKLGLGWSRCSGAQRWNRRMCQMDGGLLETLIEDTTLILGTVSLIEFAEGMQGLTDEISGAVRRFWRA